MIITNMLNDLTIDYSESKSADLFPAEPLLSWAVAAKRINSSHEHAHFKFTADFVQRNVTTEDRELANEIAAYYLKKIQILMLKGVILSKFKQDLHKFLRMSPTDIPASYGMIYSLPFFYDYDKKIDDLFAQYGPVTTDVSRIEDQELHPIGRFKTPSASKHAFEYWFYRVNQHNLPELISTRVSKENTFRPMMDHIITSKKPLKVRFNRFKVMVEDKRKSHVKLESFVLA